MTVCSWCGKASPRGEVCGCTTSTAYLRGVQHPVDDEGDALDEAIDAIYDSVDRLMREGKFADVDAVLAAIEPRHLNVTIAIAYLSITTPASALLKERRPFAARLRRHLETVEPGRVEELLRGLEEP